MRSWQRGLLAALVLTAALAAGYRLLRPAPDAQWPGPRVGEAAPDFLLQTEEGEPVRLAQFQGRTVIVNFWGTWCPECDLEMPLLQEALESHRARGLVVLGVNIGDDPDTIRRYKARRGIAFPTVLDPHRFASRLYGAHALPVTYFLDPEGIIRARYFGALDRETLNKLLVRIR